METFVVRVWTPGDAETGQAPEVLRGTVERVRSGVSATFSSAEELVASFAVLRGPRSGADGLATVTGNANGATAPESVPREP
jgi:hypothetical protein